MFTSSKILLNMWTDFSQICILRSAGPLVSLQVTCWARRRWSRLSWSTRPSPRLLWWEDLIPSKERASTASWRSSKEWPTTALWRRSSNDKVWSPDFNKRGRKKASLKFVLKHFLLVTEMFHVRHFNFYITSLIKPGFILLTVREKIGAIATPDYIQNAPGLPKTRSGKVTKLTRNVNDWSDCGAAFSWTRWRFGHLTALRMTSHLSETQTYGSDFRSRSSWTIQLGTVQMEHPIIPSVFFSAKDGFFRAPSWYSARFYISWYTATQRRGMEFNLWQSKHWKSRNSAETIIFYSSVAENMENNLNTLCLYCCSDDFLTLKTFNLLCGRIKICYWSEATKQKNNVHLFSPRSEV